MICKSQRLQKPLKILMGMMGENLSVSSLRIMSICAEPTHRIVFQAGNSVFVCHKALSACGVLFVVERDYFLPADGDCIGLAEEI